MLNSQHIIRTLFISFIFSAMVGCKKDASLPMISLPSVKGIGPTYADLQGRVYTDGGSPIEERGICWVLKNTAAITTVVQWPAITNDTMHLGGSTGLVTARIRGLQADTAYFVSFYAKNKEGVKYSYPVRVQTPKVPAGFVFVEGGDFQMGNIQGSNDEKPVHKVTLPSFIISANEVTNTQFCKFLNKAEVAADGIFNSMKLINIGHPEALITHDGTQFIPVGAAGDQPAIHVSWFGAKAYTNWAGVSLLTEAEWEYAACGGLISGAFVYAGSNTPGTIGWFADNANNLLHKGGEKNANELGIYDMSGNVLEWCEDWYAADYYGNSPVKSPPGASSGANKVLRGGSYTEPATRVTLRAGNPPQTFAKNIGFRVKVAF